MTKAQIAWGAQPGRPDTEKFATKDMYGSLGSLADLTLNKYPTPKKIQPEAWKVGRQAFVYTGVERMTGPTANDLTMGRMYKGEEAGLGCLSWFTGIRGVCSGDHSECVQHYQ